MFSRDKLFRLKKSQILSGFFYFKNKPNVFKKSQNFKIWLQKSRIGNRGSTSAKMATLLTAILCLLLRNCTKRIKQEFLDTDKRDGTVQRFFRPGPPIARNIQPINRPWTDNIYSFPKRPAHGLLNNWQSCLFCLLRQNNSNGYFAFWGKISAETILPFVEHDWLKWTYHVTSTINKVACLD